MSYDKIELENYSVNKSFSINIQVKNSGQTPAYNVISHCTLAIVKYPYIKKPLEINTDSFYFDPQISYSLIVGKFGENSFISLKSDEISEKEDSLIHKGLLNIYLWGEITYNDIFNEQHFTHLFGTFNFRGDQPHFFDQIGVYNDAN